MASQSAGLPGGGGSVTRPFFKAGCSLVFSYYLILFGSQGCLKVG